MSKTVVIRDEDCKDILFDGYHLNVWDMIVEELGLSKNATEVEVKVC